MCDMTLLAHDTIKAKKPHTCAYCYEQIAVGELYQRESYAQDGSAYTLNLHLWCVVACSDDMRAAGEHCWDTSERRPRGQAQPFRRMVFRHQRFYESSAGELS